MTLINPGSSVASTACLLILNQHPMSFQLVLDMICVVAQDQKDKEENAFERFCCLALTLFQNINTSSSDKGNYNVTIQSNANQKSLGQSKNSYQNACLAANCLSVVLSNKITNDDLPL